MSGAWTEIFHSGPLPSMSLPGALQGKPLLLYILYCVYTYLHSIVTITILWKVVSDIIGVP